MCDLCNTNKAIYDAKLPLYGAWANLCQTCFYNNDCELGLGRGQVL